ncbi:hypothetical protein BDB01DRAFT_147335 [Pilobolus umbonatus]|nr:hypothetical protein BDB01DRAFT_147335 [Pilobolus umbonatus]
MASQHHSTSSSTCSVLSRINLTLYSIYSMITQCFSTHSSSPSCSINCKADNVQQVIGKLNYILFQYMKETLDEPIYPNKLILWNVNHRPIQFCYQISLVSHHVYQISFILDQGDPMIMRMTVSHIRSILHRLETDATMVMTMNGWIN